jgi:hypothetical protein
MVENRPALNCKANSLPELMVATTVFLIAVVAILFSYIKCAQLQDMGRNISLTTAAVKNKMEEIKDTSFSTIYATYNQKTFTTTGVKGIGVIYVNNSNPDLLVVKIAFCWKQPTGLVIGEDKNLNGVLDAGEDKDGTGQIDSYVQISTQIYG